MSRGFTIYDRRRLVLAGVVTLVALPALWWAKHDSPIAQPSVAAIDAGGSLTASIDDAADIANVGTPPGYLAGPVDSTPPVLAEPAGPPLEDRFTRAGMATYKTFPLRPDPESTKGRLLKRDATVEHLCQLSFLPEGQRITVENTDNGQQIECLVNRTRMPAGTLIVMDSSLFEQLTDLSQAPIPVRIRW